MNISALGPAESRQSFGEDLAKQNIQPIWLLLDRGYGRPRQAMEVSLPAADPLYGLQASDGGDRSHRKEEDL